MSSRAERVLEEEWEEEDEEEKEAGKEEAAIWKATRSRWAGCLSLSVRLGALTKKSVWTASGFGVVVYRKRSSTTRMMFDRAHVCVIRG